MRLNIQAAGHRLRLTDGDTELVAALDHGIRIEHLSRVGMENLFYEQPADADFLRTPAGWRVRGGHRFWLAPEGPESYWPDNDPIVYEPLADGVWLRQREDPWLRVLKSVRIRFLPDGRIEVLHHVQNTGTQPKSCALWGVSTLAPGGEACVSFRSDAQALYNPSRVVALWGDANLHDPRLQFSPDSLTARHLPMDAALKLGLSARTGQVTLINCGQQLVKDFSWEPDAQYPDGGCNFEIYLCRQMLELETLGRLVTLKPGEEAEHTEIWTVTAL